MSLLNKKNTNINNTVTSEFKYFLYIILIGSYLKTMIHCLVQNRIFKLGYARMVF